ncbi:unnamed protein product, partial [Mesorhabditis spiculigera]
MPTLLILSVIFIIPTYTRDYNRLFDDLLRRYNRLVRPVKNNNETIRIEFKFKLSQIVDVFEKNQVATTHGWLRHRWVDERLAWNPKDYGGVSSFTVPGGLVWLPDIILYNTAHGSPTISSITKVKLHANGEVWWEPPVVFNSMCKIDVQWFPYDEQQCDLKFGSWTYSGALLDLRHLSSDKVIVEEEDGVKQTSFSSIDITYYIQIRRKKLFYTINLIFPCISIAALTSWLCINVLVALIIFFLVLIELIPPMSVAIPFIGKYLVFTMTMVTLSVGATVFVENVHWRGGESPVPGWVRSIFIERLGTRLLISRRTAQSPLYRKIQQQKKIDTINALHILERQFNKTLFDIEMKTQEQVVKSPQGHAAIFLQLPMVGRSLSVRTTKKDTNDNFRHVRRLYSITKQKLSEEDAASERRRSTQFCNRREVLRRAERNVNYIAQNLTEMRKADEVGVIFIESID